MTLTFNPGGPAVFSHGACCALSGSLIENTSIVVAAKTKQRQIALQFFVARNCVYCCLVSNFENSDIIFPPGLLQGLEFCFEYRPGRGKRAARKSNATVTFTYVFATSIF